MPLATATLQVEFRTELIRSRGTVDVLSAVIPLNNFLFSLHGPTQSVARTMGELVPFPEAIESFDDAEMLDFSVAICADEGEVTLAREDREVCGARSVVRASARYATTARMSQIEAFYQEQFARSGTGAVQRCESPSGCVVLESDVCWQSDTWPTVPMLVRYRVSVREERGYRSVRVAVDYSGFDYGATFERFAKWHNGDAPIPDAGALAGIEISTFASGRGPETIALYSTRYRYHDVPTTSVRALVDDRVRELGWRYCEPREGIMFMHDGAFDAETHISDADGSTAVTFVGEFQLR